MFRDLCFCLMAIVVIGGCSDTSNLITPNQIDTILSTCDTDIDIDIDNGNYTGSFDINKACVDDILLTTNPVDDTSDPTIIGKGSLIQNVSVDQLVNDTKNNGTTYQGKLVLLTAEVRYNHTESNDEFWYRVLHLTTNDPKFVLRVWFPDNFNETQFKREYKIGSTYDFVLYIDEQRLANLTDKYTWNDHSSISSYFVENGNDIQATTLNQLIRDTENKSNNYEGKIVSFNATVKYALGNNSFVLETNSDKTAFFVFYYGILKTYVRGSNHDFIIFIKQQRFNKKDNDFSIWSAVIE